MIPSEWLNWPYHIKLFILEKELQEKHGFWRSASFGNLGDHFWLCFSLHLLFSCHFVLLFLEEWKLLGHHQQKFMKIAILLGELLSILCYLLPIFSSVNSKSWWSFQIFWFLILGVILFILFRRNGSSNWIDALFTIRELKVSNFSKIISKS